MIREIVELGNPVLREQAAIITDFTDPDLPGTVQDLLDTMNSANGVGIAAQQIGIIKRVFIVASRPNDRYPHAPLMKPTVMANPYLEWASTELEKDWEGCLSIPGLRALVPRPKKIKIRYTDVSSMKEITTEYSDFLARVWLHENDHLDGIVFADRVETARDFVTDKEYKRILWEGKNI